MADEELAARWRRLRAQLEALDVSTGDDDRFRCPDQLVWTLHSLNDLFEIWRAEVVKQPGAKSDDLLEGDPAGETARALVYVRGGATHNWLEYRDRAAMEDVFIDTYTDLFTPWMWQPFVDTKKPNPRAEGWYARHIAGRGVMEPFLTALPWFEKQPVLRP